MFFHNFALYVGGGGHQRMSPALLPCELGGLKSGESVFGFLVSKMELRSVLCPWVGKPYFTVSFPWALSMEALWLAGTSQK